MGMTWNHRLIRFANQGIADNGDICDFYMIQEVHYEDDVPIGYSNFSVCSETIEGIQEMLGRLTKAMQQPVLDDSVFPKEEV